MASGGWGGGQGGRHNEVCVDVKDEAHLKGALQGSLGVLLGFSSLSPNRTMSPPS